MNFGPVNVPGVSTAELAEVKTAAEEASAQAQEVAENLVKSITLTLTSAGWDSTALTQTATNDLLLTDGYDYVVSHTSDSYAAYTEAEIYAEDVTTDGQMVFHCAAVPSSDLTVSVLRIGVSDA